MVVRSVVRRGRLRELEVGRVTFSAAGSELPAPVGATVQIPSDKSIKASVTFENTGSGTVSGVFWFAVFYAKTLSDSSGDPLTDYGNWDSEDEAKDDYTGSLTLNPGDSVTKDGGNPVTIADVTAWSEGDKIDAGVVLGVAMGGENYFLDSLKITDAIEIIAPALRVEITDVSFSEA